MSSDELDAWQMPRTRLLSEHREALLSAASPGGKVQSGSAGPTQVLAVLLLCGLSAGRCFAQSPALGEALDATNLVWTTGGNASWTGQTSTTHDGVDVAQSGVISDSQETWMETTVPGPGMLTFWWSVSSESGYDYLELRTNGVLVTWISGEVGWTWVSNRVAAGTQTVRWRYMKDNIVSSGQDLGWVDQVNFVPDAPSLVVLPYDGLVSSGFQGGPFNPSSQVYTLFNASASTVVWTVDADRPWVTSSPPGGSLAAGASTDATVRINANAQVLPPGSQNATVTFSNASSGISQSRSVQLTINALPATRYVNVNNPSPASPYTNWATAATNIQDAVDVAVAGDLILVADGVYQSGARDVYGMSNRVVVAKAVTVRSVNGPAVTQILGHQMPGTTNGPEAVRCVYLTNGAVLAGFTLTNGATQTSGDSYRNRSGGGVWCEGLSAAVSNCTLTGNSASHFGGGSSLGTLNNCTLTGNSAYYLGGGGYGSMLNACSLRGNSADSGGGAFSCTLDNCSLTGNLANGSGGGSEHGTLNYCTLASNSARYYGGGADYSTLNNCTLTGNSASAGGGAAHSTLNNCTLTGNSAGGSGGGAYSGTLNNCTLTGNAAYQTGGGAYSGTLNNCTLTGNAAYQTGGGAYSGTLTNCIVYYNTAWNGPNYYESGFAYSCTTPLPPGLGNIDTDPLLGSATHLSAQSPCIGRGSPAHAHGVDIDGEAWLNPPCMGGDQFVPGAATGELSVAITAAYSNVRAGFSVSFLARISGRLTASVWDFGDGLVVSNRPYASHAWAAPGLYEVRLTGYNNSFAGGVSATVLVRVAEEEVYYVNAANSTPVYPYTNWAGAARTIQEAIDAGTQLGRLVRVTNGVYASGGRAVFGAMTNRVVVVEGVEVRSENGPLVTIIAGQGVSGTTNNGDGAVRCVYVGTNAVLSGFTLTNGHTLVTGYFREELSGGGAWCEVSGVLANCSLNGNSAEYSGGGAYRGTLKNCILTGNWAWRDGGGAYFATLNNCALTGNSAFEFGGGAYSGTLNNCTLTGNTANGSGGVHEGTLTNCIVYYNMAPDDPNYSYYSRFAYSCTTPLPLGIGNIDTDPLLASATHLSAQSPCIGRGSPTDAHGVDIDGETWLNPPCMGADQLVPGAATGELAVAITAAYTNVGPGFPVTFVAQISGRITASVWDFGDGLVVSNRPYASHAWVTPGLYAVRLTGYNDSFSGGVAATLIVRVVAQEVYYVNAANPTPLFPYTNWAGAARTIQEAIDAGTQLGRLVRVTNGVYASGGRTVFAMMTNRVVVTEGVVVRSENGPLVTIIAGQGVSGTTNNGYGAVRCVYVGTNAILSGFTLTNGHTETTGYANEVGGGGAWCEASGVVTNCILTANSASWAGGGACSGTLNNCTLAGNWASQYGGGAYNGTLNNCTLSGNSAGEYGGAAFWGTLNYCTLTSNSANYSAGGVYEGTLNHCALTWNSARDGGGTDFCTLYNCALTGNSASLHGGGAYGGTLNNCTLADNSAGSDGGGSYYGVLNNCVVYYNTAFFGRNYANSSFAYSCTIPLPSGNGNITNPPAFQDPAHGNYRLSALSPCIDTGINQDWMFTAVDLDGRARVLNGRVDMGAYETPFTLTLRVFLQGPYDINTNGMLTGNPDTLPLTSPYAADPRQVMAIPSSVVDWVLVELQGTNGKTAVAKSAFLDSQGQIHSATGSPGITAEISAGYYSIIVKHRNHLAVMSAQPVAFTNYLVTYDFATGADKYFGGSNAAVQLEPQVWGMIAGDADGDGEVLAVDGTIHTNQLGQTGYLRSDFNLDGVVSAEDLALWTANQGRTNAASSGATILSPELTILPGRKTLLAGARQVFTAPGASGHVIWAMVKNPSGGTVTSLSATSAVYQAGYVSNYFDIVEAWDGEGRLGRAYVNVISAAEVARTGKAIVIAGQKSLEDPLWPVTDYLGDLAYNTLLYRGFAKDNIRYLNPVTHQDVDGNGEVDDIALPTTLTNVAETFTNWAVNPDRMFIYLVDHGGSSSGAGYFRLNAFEKVWATELGRWLDAIQNRYSNEVVVVIDCCESGSFLGALQYRGPGKRTVLTACGTNEPTYFVAGGQVSFSDAFFGGLLMGLDLEDAFVEAREAMSPYQRSWLDGDGDGLYEPEEDPRLAGGIYIGPSFVAGKDIPQIGHVVGNQSLRDSSRATLWAYDIVSEYPLDRVWCVVVPPGHKPDPANPVGDLPILELAYNATSGRYEAVYSGFTLLGMYKVIYYARDIWGSVSPPRQSYVTQNGFEELVIFVAGGSTNDARWAGVANLARLAYHTFRGRWFEPPSIYYLSPCGYEDVDADDTNVVRGLPTLANLQHGITSWASNANNLTVYLMGQGGNGLFRLNATENLSPADLRSWLDSCQSTNTRVSVVLDFPGAGAFVPVVGSSSGQSRVCVASSAAGQDCLFANGGTVSFSQYFLSDVFNGLDIGRAFEHARDTIARASGGLRQHPLLDDDGDGMGSVRDGLQARQRYIGTPFLTGADMPVLGTVMPDAILNGTRSLPLWVSGVTSVATISNVWCVITPPDYTGHGDLPQADLTWNEVAGRYEGLYTNFTGRGSHVCTFYARDSLGEVSSPRQAEVRVAYERGIDDALGQTPVFGVGGAQQYEFASAGAEHWVKFYAPAGCIFNIDGTPLGERSDLRLELYWEQSGGRLLFVAAADSYGAGAGFCERSMLDLRTGLSGLWAGIYYVRISSADTNLYGPGSGHRLEIYMPIGPQGGEPFPGASNDGGLLAEGSFYVYLGPPQALAAEAGWRIEQVTNENYFSDNSVIYSIPASPDWVLSFREVPGFLAPSNRSLVVNADQTTGVMAYYLYTNDSPRAECPVLGAGGGLELSFLAYAGKRYAIEESTNLVNWRALATNQVPQEGLLHFSRTNVRTEPCAFYRARYVP